MKKQSILLLLSSIAILSFSACSAKDEPTGNGEATPTPVITEGTTLTPEPTAEITPSTEPTTEPTIDPAVTSQPDPTAPEVTEPASVTSQPTPPPSTPKPTDKPTTAPKPTDKPKPTATPKPTNKPAPTPKPTNKPKPTAIPNPTSTPTPTPSTQVSLSNIYNAVKKAYGDNYLPNMEIDETTLEEHYGVKPEWYKDAIGEGPWISTHVDVFVGFEAEKGYSDDIEKALKKYKEYLVKESLQYPMNQGKVENATIVKKDNFVFFLILGGYPEGVEDTALNDLAIKTINAVIAGQDPEKIKETSDNTSVDLNTIHTKVKEAYGDRYLPDWKIDEIALSERYGLNSKWYDEIIAEYSAMRTHVDTFIAIKVKSDNKKDIVTALEAYKKYLIEDSVVYPMNIGKVNAAAIKEYDDYIFFIMLGGYQDSDDGTEKDKIKQAEKDNQIAIDILDELLIQ